MILRHILSLDDPGKERECLDACQSQGRLQEGNCVDPKEPKQTQYSQHHSVETSQSNSDKHLEQTLG